KIAHSHADQRATFKLNDFRAITNTGMAVNAEIKELPTSAAKTEARVNVPKTLNTQLKRNGYTGPSHAVGPVWPPKGLAKPWPAASDAAMFADSSLAKSMRQV